MRARSDKPVDSLGMGEVVAFSYMPLGQERHDFKAVVTGTSRHAVLFTASAVYQREQTFWIPKSWRLVGVPKQTDRWWLPTAKAREIGVATVLTLLEKW